MISDPSSIIYACVSKETTILGELTTGDPDLDAIALKCLENVPQFHSIFSHTARARTYTFLIIDPFVYLGIFRDNMEKSQRLWFLNRIKDAFLEILIRNPSDNPTSYFFQADLNPIFRNLLNHSTLKDSRNASMDSTKGMVSVPLLGSALKKKKKRFIGDVNDGETKDILGENKVVDVSDDGSGDFLHKNGGLFDGGREKAMKKWRKHVVVVLALDFAVCCVLFGIWLGVCKGFQCLNR